MSGAVKQSAFWKQQYPAAGKFCFGRGHLSLCGESKALSRCPQSAPSGLHFIVWDPEAPGEDGPACPPPSTSTLWVSKKKSPSSTGRGSDGELGGSDGSGAGKPEGQRSAELALEDCEGRMTACGREP